MEKPRKEFYDRSRHRAAFSMEDLKSKLRKMYINELKGKRDQALKGKRCIELTDEDDLDFFKYYCRQFFGKLEDPMELDEELLEDIWEEIKLADVEESEARMLDHLLEGSLSHQTICPICLKLPLSRTNHHILCDCGFKFYLPESLTLQDFESALLASNDFHTETCSSLPQYHIRLTENFKTQLISTCEACEMLNIIFEIDSC